MRRKLALAEGLVIFAIAVAFSPASSACPCGTSCRCGPGCSCGAPPPAPGPPSGLQVRKNATSLTAQEKLEFVEAVRTLKTTFRPGSTLPIYDEFVRVHGESFTGGHAHGGPAFLPWHRQFLLEFERELQAVNPNVTIPYWDFAVDRGTTGGPWTPDFMGGDGDPTRGFVVTDGPFRQGQWRVVFDGPNLVRQFGVLAPDLPTEQQVAAALAVPQYDAFSWDSGSPIAQSFRNYFEGFNHPSGDPELHNRVHVWIGGSSAIRFSPNDPIFWLLHANVDRIWGQWQDIFGPQFLPVMGAREGHNLNDPMFPFGVTPAQLLSHRALGYRYDTEPVVLVPEPSGVLLLAVGALGIALGGRRFRIV